MDSKAKTELLRLVKKKSQDQATLDFWSNICSAAYGLSRAAFGKGQAPPWALFSGSYHLVIPILAPLLLTWVVLLPLHRFFPPKTLQNERDLTVGFSSIPI